MDHLGKVVLITVLGDSAPSGAARSVRVSSGAARGPDGRRSGFNGVGIVTGTIFIVIVLLFRHGSGAPHAT